MFAVLTSSFVVRRERQRGAQLIDEVFRRDEVLDHVEHAARSRSSGKSSGGYTVIEIVEDERVEFHAGAEWKPVDAGDAGSCAAAGSVAPT